MLGFKPCRCWTFGGCTNMAPMGTGRENSTELTCQDQLAKLGGCFVSRSFGTDEGENGVGPNRRSGTPCFDLVIFFRVGTIILKQICIWGRRNLLREEEIWGLVCSLWWYCSYCGAFCVKLLTWLCFSDWPAVYLHTLLEHFVWSLEMYADTLWTWNQKSESWTFDDRSSRDSWIEKVQQDSSFFFFCKKLLNIAEVDISSLG